MKKLILILLVGALGLSVATAQEKGISFAYWGGGSVPLTKETPWNVSFNASVGYAFNSSFAAYLNVSPGISLFDPDGAGTFETNVPLGLGLNYFFPPAAMDVSEIYVGASATILDRSYNYNFYEIGYRLNRGRGKTKLFYGLGVRYYDSRTASVGNSWTLNISVGVRFN